MRSKIQSCIKESNLIVLHEKVLPLTKIELQELWWCYCHDFCRTIKILTTDQKSLRHRICLLPWYNLNINVTQPFSKPLFICELIKQQSFSISQSSSITPQTELTNKFIELPRNTNTKLQISAPSMRLL